MMTPSLPPFISRQVKEGKYWFQRLSVPDKDNVTAICGGWEHVTPDYLIDRREFVYQVVEVVVEGVGEVHLHDRAYLLTPGTVFSYGPGVSHRILTDPHHPLRKYFLCYWGQSESEILREPKRVDDLKGLVGMLDLLQLNGNSDAKYSSRISDHLTEAILLKMNEVAQSSTSLDRGAAETYLTACQYFRTDFLQIASVEQAARHLGLSPAYLARLFRRYGKTTPHHFLSRLKMTYAASILMSTNCLIKEVAEKLHFTDQFHFSRAFKAQFGIPPRDFLASTGQN